MIEGPACMETNFRRLHTKKEKELNIYLKKCSSFIVVGLYGINKKFPCIEYRPTCTGCIESNSIQPVLAETVLIESANNSSYIFIFCCF